MKRKRNSNSHWVDVEVPQPESVLAAQEEQIEIIDLVDNADINIVYMLFAGSVYVENYLECSEKDFTFNAS